MTWRDSVATRVQALKHILVQLPRPMSIRVCERGALGWCIHSQLLEPPVCARQTMLDLTQRLGTPELAEDHCHERRPRVEPLRTPVRTVVVGQLLELLTRNKA